MTTKVSESAQNVTTALVLREDFQARVCNP
jgi:hypothetical protein